MHSDPLTSSECSPGSRTKPFLKDKKSSWGKGVLDSNRVGNESNISWCSPLGLQSSNPLVSSKSDNICMATGFLCELQGSNRQQNSCPFGGKSSHFGRREIKVDIPENTNSVKRC